jgi:hypothetical protein
MWQARLFRSWCALKAAIASRTSFMAFQTRGLRSPSVAWPRAGDRGWLRTNSPEVLPFYSGANNCSPRISGHAGHRRAERSPMSYWMPAKWVVNLGALKRDDKVRCSRPTWTPVILAPEDAKKACRKLLLIMPCSSRQRNRCGQARRALDSATYFSNLLKSR